jgi:hypothetical protein
MKTLRINRQDQPTGLLFVVDKQCVLYQGREEVEKEDSVFEI